MAWVGLSRSGLDWFGVDWISVASKDYIIIRIQIAKYLFCPYAYTILFFVLKVINI